MAGTTPLAMYTFTDTDGLTMCLYPAIFQGNPVACRECDQCYDARINGWVTRAMAERAVAGRMLAITLTYADLPTGEKPVGATVFNYKHVQDFIKAVREAYYRKYNTRGEIRFIVCGERGSKGTQRMHWHLLLFTDKPLGVLGKILDFFKKKVLKDLVLEQNIWWSLWPHGHVRVQEPNARGVFYALKYAFKDHNTVEKSKGTNRYALANNWGASMFRMSKHPPIGMRYLVEYLDKHEKRGAVPPTLKIKIPEYSGFWYPTGVNRTYALERCHKINADYRARTGRDTPQWASLLHSVSQTNDLKPNNDWETLYYGPQAEQQPTTEQQQQREKQQFVSDLADKRSAHESRAILAHCGHILPCKECRLRLTPEQNAELNGEEEHWFRQWAIRGRNIEDPTDIGEFRRWWLTHYRTSRGCLRRNDEQHFQVFRHARGLKKFAKKLAGPRTEADGRNTPGSRPRPHRIET